jgi:hypothetical protein
MTITTHPVPARTDAVSATTAPRQQATATVRRTGWMVAAGGAVWSAALFAVSPQATDNCRSPSPTSARCRSKSACSPW